MPPLQPTRLLLIAIAGWSHREQAATIDYLLEENRAFREQPGKRRLRRHLQGAVDQDVAHFNAERPHQGLGNELITQPRANGAGEVMVGERLGGLLKHYRKAA